jgi:Replication-relaxation
LTNTVTLERLTATELAILSELEVYRFLTPAQLLSLGVTRDKRHLYMTLSRLALRTPKIVVKLDFGALPGRGRLPVLYALAPHGAELLADATRRDPEEIHCPERIRLFHNDYFHRVHCVDLHIAVRQWAARTGATIEFFDTYFDYGTAQDGRAHARTRIPLPQGALIPDAMFSFTTKGSPARLCALEMYNGMETGRVERQLAAYITALDNDAINTAYGYPHAVRVLCVFEHARGLELVRRRLSGTQEFRESDPHFFCKTLADARTDLHRGWQRIASEREVSLF